MDYRKRFVVEPEAGRLLRHHRSMPEAAQRFALPRALSDEDIRRHAHELIFP